MKAAQCLPTTTDLNSVRQFLGMSSYYRTFIPRFAKVAEPLHESTRNDTKFVWSKECKSAFKALKESLCVFLSILYGNVHPGDRHIHSRFGSGALTKIW